MNKPTTKTKGQPAQDFSVPWPMHQFSGFVQRHQRLWKRLGDFETWVLRDRLRNVQIVKPVYVAGLARSGTTILLEILAAHADVETHQYRDFPALFTPYWWRHVQRWSAAAGEQPVERAHQDGLLVTRCSPEAMEEMLWMAFFADAHDPGVSQVLAANRAEPEFEQFYRDHVRKLLLSRGRTRYVSKGNYNVARLGYLQKMFSDARFLVPIRHPRSHIASLMKQHRLFAAGQAEHTRAVEHLRRVGHFEFGLDRRPIHVGKADVVQSVVDAWRQGNEVLGWARYWAALYGWLLASLESNPRLRDASLVVRFEDLCDSTDKTLAGVLRHCDLDDADLVARFASRVRAPTYYAAEFSEADDEVIAAETSAVAARYGYSVDVTAAPTFDAGELAPCANVHESTAP